MLVFPALHVKINYVHDFFKTFHSTFLTSVHSGTWVFSFLSVRVLKWVNLGLYKKPDGQLHHQCVLGNKNWNKSLELQFSHETQAALVTVCLLFGKMLCKKGHFLIEQALVKKKKPQAVRQCCHILSAYQYFTCIIDCGTLNLLVFLATIDP